MDLKYLLELLQHRRRHDRRAGLKRQIPADATVIPKVARRAVADIATWAQLWVSKYISDFPGKNRVECWGRRLFARIWLTLRR